MLDNPALASLGGHHARFAERRGEVVRYQADVSPWAGFPDEPTAADWHDAAALLGSGAHLGVSAAAELPEGWVELEGFSGVQLTGEAVEGRQDPEAVALTPDDVPEILDLVERAKPGPYLARTIELGRYVGFRDGGRLIALAGERLHPPGWTEISAVCTDDEHRGRGLATRLVLDVVHGIRQRGDLPMLHAAGGNTPAIRLYEHLGFTHRARPATRFVRVP
ncbi:GCN5 family acetyltransferase [Frondihabitans sp. PAMC 28766]|nr:GCN5 family acetyltransferase [Frondihabitans sp. PAMC 28766]